jgi:hypothetical protein
MKRLTLLAAVAALLSYGLLKAAEQTSTAATSPKTSSPIATAPATMPTAPKPTEPAPTSTVPKTTAPKSTETRPVAPDQGGRESDDEMARNAPPIRIGMRGVGGRGQPVAPPPPSLAPQPTAQASQSDWVWLGAAVGAVLLALAGTFLLLRRQKPAAPSAPTAYDPYA